VNKIKVESMATELQNLIEKIIQFQKLIRDLGYDPISALEVYLPETLLKTGNIEELNEELDKLIDWVTRQLSLRKTSEK